MTTVTESRQDGPTRRVWVGCLACYNGGMLRGAWVTPLAAPLWTCLNRAHEETWCFDHEGWPTGTGEMSPVEAWERDAQYAQDESDAAERGLPWAAVVAYREEWGADADLDAIADAYAGTWDDLADWAAEFLDDTGMLASVPESLRYHVDVASWARDCRLSGDIWTSSTDDHRVIVWWTR